MDKTQVKFSTQLDSTQFEKFTSFLVWLKKDRAKKLKTKKA